MRTIKAQGTIEYLVILAVVVIVALIVVSLMINSTAPAQGISGTTSSIASASNIIAVTESIVDEDGNYFLKIKNNSGENITITNIKIGETSTEPGLFARKLTGGRSNCYLYKPVRFGEETNLPSAN